LKLKAANFPCFLQVKIYTNGKNRSLAAAKAENRPQAPTAPDFYMHMRIFPDRRKSLNDASPPAAPLSFPQPENAKRLSADCPGQKRRPFTDT